MKYITFFSKYPYKNWPCKNKEILYQGSTEKIPTEFKNNVFFDNSAKFIIIYKDK